MIKLIISFISATGGGQLINPTPPVTSVNGETGAVTLNSSDVGAEPSFTKNTAFNKNFGSAADTVCQGNDARLSNARPASDVSAWAKASTKPTYTANEVGAVPTSRTVNNKALNSDITLTKDDIGLNKVDNVKQYSATNAPPIHCYRFEAEVELAGNKYVINGFLLCKSATMPILNTYRYAVGSVIYSRSGSSGSGKGAAIISYGFMYLDEFPSSPINLRAATFNLKSSSQIF